MSNVFVVVEAEMRVNERETYVVQRAYRDASDGWSAMYASAKESHEILTFSDAGEAEWWPNLGDAQMACREHRRRMDAGDTAAEAAAWLASNGIEDDSDEPAGRDPEPSEKECGL